MVSGQLEAFSLFGWVWGLGGSLNGERVTLIDGFDEVAQNSCIFQELVSGTGLILYRRVIYLFLETGALLFEILIIKFLGLS